METPEDIKAQIMDLIQNDPEARSQMREAVMGVAEDGAIYARSIAPIGGATDPFAGTFRSSIHAEEYTQREGRRTLPAARIISEDPAAVAIEYGTSKTPEHHTFADTEVYLAAREGGPSTIMTKPYWTSEQDVDPSLRQR